MSNSLQKDEIEEIKTYFNSRFCNNIEQALHLKFPSIEELEVDMNEQGEVSVLFTETEYTQKEVEDYLKELKSTSPKELPNTVK